MGFCREARCRALVMRPVFLNIMWSSNTLAVVLKRLCMFLGVKCHVVGDLRDH